MDTLIQYDKQPLKKKINREYDLINNLELQKLEKINIQEGLGNLYLTIGEWDLAEELFYDNIRLSYEINNDKWLGQSKMNFAEILRNKGYYKEAMVYLKSAHDIFQRIDFKKGVGITLRIMGLVQYNTHNLEQSISILNHAMTIIEELNDPLEEIRMINSIGITFLVKDEISKAKEYFERMTGLCLKIKDMMGLSTAKINIGVVYVNMSDYDKAMKYFDKSLKISKKIGNKKGMSLSLSNIGLILIRMGKYKKAYKHITQNLKLAREMGHKLNIGISLGNLGIIYYKKNMFRKALDRYNRAIRHLESINNQYYLSSVLESKAEIYFDLGIYHSAGYYNIEAMKMAEHQGRKEVYFHARLLNVKLLSKRDKIQAKNKLKDMLKEYDKDVNKAYILFELYKITEDSDYGKKALNLFNKLYRKTPIKDYEDFINKLKKNAYLNKEDN
jgi:tetratricopeptide (TPR) repeat protein